MDVIRHYDPRDWNVCNGGICQNCFKNQTRQMPVSKEAGPFTPIQIRVKLLKVPITGNGLCFRNDWQAIFWCCISKYECYELDCVWQIQVWQSMRFVESEMFIFAHDIILQLMLYLSIGLTVKMW